jgi:hypothetical protein
MIANNHGDSHSRVLARCGRTSVRGSRERAHAAASSARP